MMVNGKEKEVLMTVPANQSEVKGDAELVEGHKLDNMVKLTNTVVVVVEVVKVISLEEEVVKFLLVEEVAGVVRLTEVEEGVEEDMPAVIPARSNRIMKDTEAMEMTTMKIKVSLRTF
jgi:hypothetical protein